MGVGGHRVHHGWNCVLEEWGGEEQILGKWVIIKKIGAKRCGWMVGSKWGQWRFGKTVTELLVERGNGVVVVEVVVVFFVFSVAVSGFYFLD